MIYYIFADHIGKTFKKINYAHWWPWSKKMANSSLNISSLGKTILEERLAVSVKFHYQESIWKKVGNEHEFICLRKP